jgi:hypothetical protein
LLSVRVFNGRVWRRRRKRDEHKQGKREKGGGDCLPYSSIKWFWMNWMVRADFPGEKKKKYRKWWEK